MNSFFGLNQMMLHRFWRLWAFLGLLCWSSVGFSWADVSLPDPVRFGIAVEQGDVRSVQAWLDAGLSPDFMADRVGSGLMIAAWEGNLPMLELFVARGAQVNLVNRYDEQALQLAVWRGHTAAVRWLLEHGADLNRQGRWSALHYAVFANHGELAQLLLERGAEINARAPNGSTVLMMAAREGHEKLARQLLDAGADSKLRNERGESALTWAMRQGNYRIAQMVSSMTEFSQAALADPTSFGSATRSQAAPLEIEEILRQIRLAQAAGKPIDRLRKKLYETTARFKQGSRKEVLGKSAVKTPQKPGALMITARRGAAQSDGLEREERAELVYSQNMSTKPASASVGDIGAILQRIQQAQAAGQSVVALRKQLFTAVAKFKQNPGAVEPEVAHGR